MGLTLNIRHSKGTKRWGTPADASKGGVHDIIGLCRKVIGVFDLDPCTETKFEPVVGALRGYSLTERGEDGLVLPWFGKVLCNPPGGLVTEFWERALSQETTGVMWVGFSVEQLCTLADATSHPLDFSCCLLRARIPFTRHDGYEGSPSHANYVAGLMVDHGLFKEVFSPFGKVTAGKYALNI